MSRLAMFTIGLVCAITQVAVGNDTSDRIRQLREEKALLLKETLEFTTKRYESGQATMMEVLLAKITYFDAGLELLDTREKRLAQLTRIVGVAEEMVKLAEQLATVKEGTLQDVRKAKVTLIERKIALEQEN